MVDRSQIRMSRRGSRQEKQAPAVTRTFPRGMPQAGTTRRRIAEVVAEHTEPIPVDPAVPPRSRRMGLVPTDATVAAIQEGMASIDAHLAQLIALFRQVHGLDEADQELDELRRENEQLQLSLQSAHAQIQQMSEMMGAAATPVQPEIEATEIEATEGA